jgi:hypothetical protein
MIDNYAEAMALVEDMKKQLPIPVTVTGGFRRSMKEKGVKLKADQLFQIRDVLYSGDQGGIMCDVTPSADATEVLLSSLTHLRVNPRHPLGERIRDYQQVRTQKLAAQGSFGTKSSTLTRNR